MKIDLKIHITVLLLWLTVNSLSVNAETAKANILVLGDSLSSAYGINTHEGWVALAQKTLDKNKFDYKIVNASVSGDTSRTGLNRLKSALEVHEPSIVIVALGGNDGLRGIAFEETENSLSEIIRHSKDSGAKVLLLGVRLPTNYGQLFNSRFADIFKRLSSRYDVELIPQMLKDVAEKDELMQEDGIHPTASAQHIIFDNIWPTLKKLL